ncbi:MAG TPA: HEAT repeat domain-containing protein [Blastocatellia bacterium]|nr:HEAT repeat domain-containing protein [Blastocatellia bacterium]
MSKSEISKSNEFKEEPFQWLQTGGPVLRFRDSIRNVAISLDARTDEELVEESRRNPIPAFREQALYQILHRLGEKAIPSVQEALFNDPDPEVRINLLWALEDLDVEQSSKLALALLVDENSRVREWARVFCWEKGWVKQDFRQAKEARYYDGRTFDQTIYLHIKSDLYIKLTESNELWGHLIMSPQMLAYVYGQAYACPISRTREQELVIAKTLKGLHEDGSDHYESFLFRGFTERTARLSGNFYFETNTRRPFFVSGKADDLSEGVVADVQVPFAREGQWFLNENINVKGKKAIEYVRGLFQGWAYVNFERIQKSGGEYLFPGNSVLSTLHHPVVGKKTNTFIAGSFKGKVIDWDGDGVLDLNYLQAPATAGGEVDSDFDGIPDVPGMSVCSRPFQS